MGLGVQNRPSEEARMQVKGTVPWGWRSGRRKAPVEDEGVGVGGVREEVAAALGGGRAWGVGGGVHIDTTSASSFARCSSD